MTAGPETGVASASPATNGSAEPTVIDEAPAQATDGDHYAPGSLRYIDTIPRHDLPVYSDGNFGEVAPDRLSPMSWSLVGFPMEAASRQLAACLAPGQRWFTGSRFSFVGQFALKPYHNLTAFCSLAGQMPGVEPADVTRSFFEDQPPPDLFRGARASAATRARMADRFARYWLGVLRDRPTLDGELALLEAKVDAFTDSERSLLLVPEFWRIVEHGWVCHIAATCATVPLSVMASNVGRRLFRHWDDIETDLIAPRELVWHSLYGPGGSHDPFTAGFLSAPFYEVADDLEPWTDFVKPRSLLAMAEGERQSSDVTANLDRVVSHRRLQMLDKVSGALSRASEEREASKALVMRALHVGRRLVRDLAAVRGIENWPYLTFDELSARSPQSSLLSVPELNERADARAGQAGSALRVDLPSQLDVREVYPTRRPASPIDDGPGRVLAPAPGTPRLSGMALRWPLSRSIPEDQAVILVCESADADIQPVLPLVTAVVAERGSLMSHIAILCRGWGLPCLAHPAAGQIEDGDLITLDIEKGSLNRDQR